MSLQDVLFGNRIINTVLIACILAQALKVVITYLSTRKLDFTRLITTGGMPSSHASTVMSLVTCIGRTQGVYTPMFALSFVFAMVTLYDATGIRRAAGKQARVLNKIVDNWGNDDDELLEGRLKELLGHTPIEVFWGSVLGIVIGMMVNL